MTLAAALLGARPAPLAAAPTLPPPRRTQTEAVWGVTGAGVYGAATTLWALSLATPDLDLRLRLTPALLLGAGAAWAVAAYDRAHPFASGTLANTVAGGVVGAAISGAWIWRNHAAHERAERWSDGTSATLLWAGATLGAGIGALSALRGTTPGRAAFTGTAPLWLATSAGLLAASAGGASSAEARGLLTSAVALELGVIGASWLGRRLNPSVSRVLLVNACAATGALLLGTGAWWLSGRDDLGESRAAWAAAGAGILLGGGWALW